MREYAVILKPTRENMVATLTEDEAHTVGQHFNYFAGMYEQGKLKYAGRCEDGYLGVSLFVAESAEEVEQIMEDDPAILAGVMTYKVKQWRSVLTPEGWPGE